MKGRKIDARKDRRFSGWKRGNRARVVPKVDESDSPAEEQQQPGGRFGQGRKE